MNLAEMLTFADIEVLTKIADHYKCVCNTNSKHELIQTILGKMGRREYFEELLDELGTEDLRFLNTLLFDGRKQFSLEELLACASQAKWSADDQDVKTQIRPRDLVTRFRQKGWLFTGRSTNERFLFELPEDLKMGFRTGLEQRMLMDLKRVQAPAAYREEPIQASEDLFLLIDYIHRHEIVLNAEGAMYRRYQTQIMDKLHVSEPLLGRSGWRFGYGRKFKDYPSRLAFLYDYATYRRWIEERGGILAVTSAGQTVLAEERREPLIQLIRFWLRLYKGPIPNLLSLVYWIDRGSKGWVSANSLFVAMERFINPYYYDTPESIFQERILKMMLHLGMIRIGEDEQEGMIVRMTAAGRAAVEVICQARQEPDFRK
ncbi:hypothetical protein DCC85_12690 [Paenibacillus sp. CAA11]|nr:hypothetical protein DCC85_12690 [Paenibacillus sp. CAA11]